MLSFSQGLRVLQQTNPIKSPSAWARRCFAPSAHPTSSSNLLFAVLGMPLPPGILAIEPGSLVFWEVTLLTSRWSSSTPGTSPAVGLCLSWLGSLCSCFGTSMFLQSTWLKSLVGRLLRDTCFFGSTWSFQDLGFTLLAVLLLGFLFVASSLKLVKSFLLKVFQGLRFLIFIRSCSSTFAKLFLLSTACPSQEQEWLQLSKLQLQEVQAEQLPVPLGVSRPEPISLVPLRTWMKKWTFFCFSRSQSWAHPFPEPFPSSSASFEKTGPFDLPHLS